MSFQNVSEFNVIVLNLELSTIFPILTITSTKSTYSNNNNYNPSSSSYPSIIVNIYNETNFFINNATSVSSSPSLSSSSSSITSSSNLENNLFSTSATTNLFHLTTNLTTKASSSSKNDTNFQNSVIVPLYAVIFLLSVVGNFLVILTLAQNKRMRTVTNVYLLNLAVSDLLLGVFCMPFTLVGQMLRNFVFGKLMCKLIPYFQAVSVSVAVWTLVAISLERYFAICRPLTSRRWQTQFHATKMIVLVWIISFVCNSPLLLVQELQPLSRGGEGAYKCREVWPSQSSERTYVIFLDIALLLLPLVAMGLAYSLIVSKLWRGLKREMKHTTCSSKEIKRSPSLNTVNGIIIAGTNSEAITPYTNLTSPARSKKNRLIVHSTPQISSQNNYVNFLQKSMKSKSSSNILKNNRKPKQQKAEAVKLWLFKSIVVRPNRNNGKMNNTSPPAFQCQRNTSSFNNHDIMTEIELNNGGPVGSGGNNGNGGSIVGGCTNNSNGSGNGDGVLIEREVNNVRLNDVREDIEIKDGSPEQPDLTTYTFCRHAIRSNYMDKSIEAKKKVIRMLFVIIVEFFVCWAPIHILNTVYLFSPAFVYHHVSSTGIALVQLMAYISSCCNPITYCFMNRRFRQAFMAIFNCYNCRKCCCKSKTDGGECRNIIGRELIGGLPLNSDASGNDSIVYLGRTNGLNRSEVLVLEAEDRV